MVETALVATIFGLVAVILGGLVTNYLMFRRMVSFLDKSDDTHQNQTHIEKPLKAKIFKRPANASTPQVVTEPGTSDDIVRHEDSGMIDMENLGSVDPELLTEAMLRYRGFIPEEGEINKEEEAAK